MKLHPIIRELATADPDDPWGDCLTVHFAVADCLTVMDEDIPESWEYSPSPMLAGMSLADVDAERDYPTNYIAESVVLGQINADDLRHAGNVLSRYANVLKLAGRDY